MLARFSIFLLGAAVFALSPVFGAGELIERKTFPADREKLQWYPWVKDADKPYYRNCSGWIEFDFEIRDGGWYELWRRGVVEGWNRDFYLDGKLHRYNYTTDRLRDSANPPAPGFVKEFNLFLPPGKHTMRFLRTQFPGGHFGDAWKLVASDGAPLGSATVKIPRNVVRAGDPLILRVRGGAAKPAAYEFIAQAVDSDAVLPLGKVEFPVSAQPVEKTVRVTLSNPGVYRVLARRPDGAPGRPADLGAGRIAVIDTVAPAAGTELKETPVADIDCVKTPPYREKDGKTRIVSKPFGTYRESSGNASNSHWALDGFSYKIALPEGEGARYRMVIDYPDDAFRSCGFWSNDGVTDGERGAVLTGGVETGGEYPLSNTMKTHEAFLYPRSKELIVAVLNLNRGSRAAASRIRLYQVHGPLPAAPAGARRGRLAGEFFEEYGRWKRHFGMGRGNGDVENIRTAERWAEWNRYVGKNLMHPSVVAYFNVLYPSKVLPGSQISELDQVRMFALVAEKFNNRFLPHITLHCSNGLDETMGIQVAKVKDAKGRDRPDVRFLTPESRDVVSYGRDGSIGGAWCPVAYNALHPKVQAKYLEIVGELADNLADCKSFEGISMRVPLPWQYAGWNALLTGNKGYGDWTVGEFEKETGIKVPGAPGDPKRFAQRYTFLMGQKRAEWLRWRQTRLLDFWKRIRDRIRKARPGTGLYVVWWNTEKVSRGDISALRELAESGVDLERLAKEDGITLIAAGAGYGRRYFTPYGDARRIGELTDPENFPKMRSGKRAFNTSGAYYEVNSNLKWDELGGKKYHAFDTLAPNSVHEMKIPANALASGDAGVFTGGGNGWIFGTMSLQRPFMREFLALPPGFFEAVPGTGDPVAVRSRREGKTLWFYAVNRTPDPVHVQIAGPRNARSAVDDAPAALRFTLAPYGLAGFRADGAEQKITGVHTSPNPAAMRRVAPLAAFAADFRRRLADGAVAPELPKSELEKVLGTLDQAVSSAKSGAYWHARELLFRPELAYVYDLAGSWPPGLFENAETVGGYPPDTPEFPRPTLQKTIGGDPLEYTGPVWFTRVGDRVQALLSMDGRARLLEFTADGKFLRSPRLAVFSRGVGDIRNIFLPGPGEPPFGTPSTVGGAWYLRGGNTVYKYDATGFRGLDSELGFKPPENATKTHPAIRFHAGKTNLSGATPLKVHDGAVWFLSYGKLRKLDPATDLVRDVVAAPGASAFAFAPNGDLFLALPGQGPTRGISLARLPKNGDGFGPRVPCNGGKPLAAQWYLYPSDLEILPDGAAVVRFPNWNKMDFLRWREGEGAKPFYAFGGRDFRQCNLYGLGKAPDGDIFAGAGGARKLARIAPDGTLRWRRVFRPDQTGDSLPLRAPVAVSCDGRGRYLWCADWDGDRILCFDAATGRYLGKFGDSAQFRRISGLAAVGDALYVADSGNVRLLKFKIHQP